VNPVDICKLLETCHYSLSAILFNHFAVNHPHREGWLFVFLSGAGRPDEIKFYAVDPIGIFLSREENFWALTRMRARKLLSG
jgi:hypothetical protein